MNGTTSLNKWSEKWQTIQLRVLSHFQGNFSKRLERISHQSAAPQSVASQTGQPAYCQPPAVHGAISSSFGYVKDTGTPKGRGVFVSRTIGAGEVIEVCPAIILSVSIELLPIEMQRFVYDWGFLAKQIESCAVVLGYGSMYNHGNPSNLRYEALADIHGIRFVAARDIVAHEELTINYNAENGGTVSDCDSWFETVGITPWVG